MTLLLDTPIHPAEFHARTPELFADMPWIRYGETRRVPGSTDPLSGSVAQADAPLDDSYDLLQPNIERTAFKEVQRLRAQQRISTLMSQLGLRELGRPKPEYGVRLVTDDAFSTIDSQRSSRAFADAVHTETDRRGLMFSPADCPLLILTDTRQQDLTVIHAGYKSLAADIAGKTLSRLPFHAPDTHVYVSPHATSNYPIYGPPLEELESSAVTRNHLGPTAEDGRSRVLHFGAAITERLVDFGIKEHHIEISRDNSLENPTLYSQRNFRTKGINGRNGVMAGLRQVS